MPYEPFSCHYSIYMIDIPIYICLHKSIYIFTEEFELATLFSKKKRQESILSPWASLSSCHFLATVTAYQGTTSRHFPRVRCLVGLVWLMREKSIYIYGGRHTHARKSIYEGFLSCHWISPPISWWKYSDHIWEAWREPQSQDRFVNTWVYRRGERA